MVSINRIKTDTSKKLCNLKAGTVFMICPDIGVATIFMKTDSPQDEEILCVDLDNGEINYIKADTNVFTLDATISVMKE